MSNKNAFSQLFESQWNMPVAEEPQPTVTVKQPQKQVKVVEIVKEPKPKKEFKNYALRIPKDRYEALLTIVERNDGNINATINQAIREFIERNL